MAMAVKTNSGEKCFSHSVADCLDSLVVQRDCCTTKNDLKSVADSPISVAHRMQMVALCLLIPGPRSLLAMLQAK